MSKHTRFIEDTFTDKNIVRALKDYVFVLDAHETQAKGGTIGNQQRNDVLATALFGGMNNSFHAFVAPYARAVILDLLMQESYTDLSARFLERIAPQIKTLLNDETPRDFFTVAADVRRKLA